MEAVILAAGEGKRLRPHTLTTPKPMLPVQGRPILDWILAALPRDLQRVVVVVNYLAEQVEAYLKTRPYGRVYETVRQEVPRGTGDAFRSCQATLNSDRYLVLNADDLYSPADLTALAKVPAGLMVHPVDEPRKFGIAFPNPDGTLRQLVEKPDLEGRHLANIGVYLFPREVFSIDLPLSPRGEYEITDYVSRLNERMPVRVITARHWYPIGTVEAFEQAQTMDLSPFRVV